MTIEDRIAYGIAAVAVLVCVAVMLFAAYVYFTSPSVATARKPMVTPTEKPTRLPKPTAVPPKPVEASPTPRADVAGHRGWPPALQGVCYAGGLMEDVERLAVWVPSMSLIEQPGEVETVPFLCRSKQDPRAWTEEKMVEYAEQHPGSYWMVFNEPDLPDYGDLSPEAGAYLFRALESIILGADPTAKLIVGGVSQLNSPAWEEEFLTQYEVAFGQPKNIAGWHIHYYPGVEGRASAEIYAQRTRDYVLAFNRWAAAHGGGEVWLSEFSVLHDDQEAMDYLHFIQPWLKDNVDRYAWFATDTTWGSWTGGSLLYATGGLTPLGEVYASLSSKTEN